MHKPRVLSLQEESRAQNIVIKIQLPARELNDLCAKIKRGKLWCAFIAAAELKQNEICSFRVVAFNGSVISDGTWSALAKFCYGSICRNSGELGGLSHPAEGKGDRFVFQIELDCSLTVLRMGV